MTRQWWALTIGLAVCGGTGMGCLRPTESPGPVVRRAPKTVAEAPISRAGASAAYHTYPPPRGEAFRHETPSPAVAAEPQPTVDRPVDLPPLTPPIAKETPKDETRPVAEVPKFPSAQTATEHPLVVALQCRLDNRPEEARRQLETYDEPARQFLFGMLGLMARFSDASPSHCASPETGELIDDLSALLEPLRPRAPLKIAKICFCNRIKTFGVYEPLSERVQFRADDQVHVYVELRNFATVRKKEPNGDVRHVINLRSAYEIHDENRKVVCEDVFLRDREAADESRTPRHDYFENYVFTVPKLKPGFYTLWIKIEDLGNESPRLVKGSLDFHIPNSPTQVTQGTK